MTSKDSTIESAWDRLEKLRPSLEEHSQDHLLRFAAELSEAERETLADELASLELEKVAKIFKATMADVESGSKKDDLLEPLGPSILGSTLLGLGHALVTHMVEEFRKDEGVDITKDAMAPR